MGRSGVGPQRRRAAALLLAVTSLASTTFGVGVLVGSLRAPRDASVLDQAVRAIEADAENPAAQRTLDAVAIRAMLASLHDRWASYSPPGQDVDGTGALAELASGRFSGVGMWLSAGPGGGALVRSVLAGSPAQRAGIDPGEVIRAIAGQPVSALGLTGAVAALRGTAGTIVSLVVTSGSAVRVLSVRRAQVAAGDVTVTTVAPGVVDIQIAAFSAGVGGEVTAAVQAAQADHVQGIVLDLRGNPGGLLSEALAVASAFLDGGPVVRLSGRSLPDEVLDAAAGGDTATPLVVLVDGGTASAAEVVAGALQDRGRAVLIGSRTFGKGSVQEAVRLSDGSVIEVTVAHYRTPDGQSIDGVGLVPDIEVPVGADPSVALTDAIALLAGLSPAPS